MVGIRRGAPPRLRGVGKSSGGGTTWNSSSMIKTCFVGVVALYGFSILVSLIRAPSTESKRTGNSGGNMGVQEVLKNSHLRIPPKQQQQQQQQSDRNHNLKVEVAAPGKDLADLAAAKPYQKPPPPIHNDDYHLEEPDIHMQLPDPTTSVAKQNPADKAPPPPPQGMNNNINDSKGSPINQIVVNKKGTGSTTVAYVRDFQTERDSPAFRRWSVQANDSSKAVAAMVKELKVTGCLQLENIGGHRRWNIQAACLDPDTPQIAYNTANFGRTWCGQEIQPHSAMVMSERCNDSTVHIFPHEQTAPVSGRGMPPMILKSSLDKVQDESTLQTVECDIPCLQEPGLAVMVESLEYRYFEGENWEIIQTLANSYSDPSARIERIDYRHDKYYSTQSFLSSVPLSFYDPEKFILRNRPPISYESAKPKAVYMINEACASPGSKRQKYFAAIDSAFSVDSVGDCHHNTEIPQGMTIATMEGRIEIMKQYRFVLAFDRTKEKDHISDIIWEALISGSVPVIVGADNMRNHLPAHSYIDSGSYSDWDELAQAIKNINEDKDKWESYHAWRTDEAALAKFEAMYEFTKTSPTCRLCRWGYAKKYGMGWDQVKQQVTETHLPRNLCTTSPKGLASKPFQEEWISRNEDDEIVVNREDENATDESCTPLAKSVIDNKSTYKIDRTLVEHDGVTDLIVTDIERETTKQELVLRLHFPGVRNSDGAHFVNTHTTVNDLTHGQFVSSASMQDDFTKVTVLADWSTSIKCPKDSILEIVVVEQHENEEQPTKPLWPNIPKRLRIIVEDMNVIHDKMTEYFPSSFAATMIKDFVDPLEIYYADS